MAAIYSNGVTAGIFSASILIKEMRYLVYIRYLWWRDAKKCVVSKFCPNSLEQARMTSLHIIMTYANDE
jgi:hypothetical protein